MGQTKDLSTELLTDKEAAAYMKLTPKSGWKVVQRWARQGRIRAGRVGDKYVFRRQDIDDFIFAKR